MLVTLVACAGQLGLAVAAMFRGTKGPLALPLALLCVDLFAWNFANLGHQLSGQNLWRHFDLASSPLTAPLGFHFVLTFTGLARRLRKVLIGVYVAFAALAAVSLVGIFVPAAEDFVFSSDWAVLFLCGAIPVLMAGFAILVKHLGETVSPAEQARTRLLFAAFFTLAAFGFTELLHGLNPEVPRLGNVGALACTTLMAVVALKFNLFERELSSLATIGAAVLGASAVLICIAALQWVGSKAGLTMMTTAAATFVLGAVARQLLVSSQQRRQRAVQLATMGQYSAQMAHDLKNPLAALKGGLQFLSEELKQNRSVAEQQDLVKLLLAQSERVSVVVEQYQRLARMEPVFEKLEVNGVVKSVLSLQGLAESQVQVKQALADELPPCTLDRHLLAGAIENLVRNAFEAMPNGGTLTVRSQRGELDGREAVVLGVDDTGPGMDGRTKERAFDAFYTTKVQGSGLGLAFVRRAVEALGGSVTLSTRPGHGCQFRLFFPVEQVASPRVDEKELMNERA